MSVFVQEVLGLLKRNFVKTTLNPTDDYFQFVRKGALSRAKVSAKNNGNIEITASSEPKVAKYKTLSTATCLNLYCCAKGMADLKTLMFTL